VFSLMTTAVISSTDKFCPVEGWMPIVKMFSALFIVLGILGFLTYVVKRYYPGIKGAKSSGPTVRVLQTVYLGSKRSIAVIGVENKRLIVGMTPSSMTLLASLDETGEALPLEKREEVTKRTLSFSKILRNQFMRNTEEVS